MIAKYWKRIGLIILIVACLWNLIFKISNVVSFDKAMNALKYQVERVSGNIKK